MARVNFRVPGGINADDLTVDSTTLTVDETNNRVGIVNASPSVELDVTGVVKASSGVVTLTVAGTPSSSIADGALAVDVTNNKFYFRSNSVWREVSGGSGSTASTQNFTIPGTLFVGAGQTRWYAPRSLTISTVQVSVGTAPTGASVIFDVNKNGTTIFTTQGNRPTITSGSNSDLASVPDVTTLASGDYLTVDVDQIGSTVAGADAVVQIEFS